MGFWIAESENGGTKVELYVDRPQSFAQSILICLSLVYLAVPNLLFLWGWLEPWLAVTASLLLLFALGRAVCLTFEGMSIPTRPSFRRVLSLALGTAAASLICFFFLFRPGLLGILPSFYDFDILRNAMFSNLRDAAWPLILPNGKEMSYYLAGVLPPACLSRIVPACGQWTIVLWTGIAMLLALLMISSQLRAGRRSWGWTLFLVSVLMAFFCSPLITRPAWRVMMSLCFHAGEFINMDLNGIFSPRFAFAPDVLGACGICYNSCAPALLMTALLMVCRNRAEVVLPVAFSLLVPLSPMSGVGLLPLVLVSYLPRMKWGMKLLLDIPLPVFMAFLCALYFTRGQGESAATLTVVARGWSEFIKYEAWSVLSWAVLIVPLFFIVKRDAFFYTLLFCCLALPAFFIGTVSASGGAGNNELALKTCHCYNMLIACYWMQAWRRLGWFKYLMVALWVATTCWTSWLYLVNWGAKDYLEVDDQWNGHLNHGAAFLNQSVPHCNAPMVPGVLLREAGESEKHFPGCLLPQAPGCDYSRPARVGGPKVAAPL